MAQTIGYTAAELRKMLADSFLENFKSRAGAPMDPTLPNDLSSVVAESNARLILSALEAVAEIIEKNNRKLSIELLEQGQSPLLDS